ncbi:MAG: hypothetical protein NVS1B2_25140 [Vulcanimicrobiaceae bacterium]
MPFLPTPAALTRAIDELDDVGSAGGGSVDVARRRAALAAYLDVARKRLPRHVRFRHDYEALSFEDLVWSSGRLRVATSPAARAVPDGKSGDAPSLAVENAGGIVHAGSTFLQPATTRGDDRLTIVALADAADARAMHGRVARFDDDRFVALATAFQNCGVFVDIPPGVVLDAPVQIVWTGAPGPPQAIFPATVVRVGAGARVTIVERHVGNVDALLCGTVEVDLGAGAHVDYVVVGQIDDGARSFVTRAARCATGASIAWHVAELGGALVRSIVATELAGDRARTSANALFFARGFANVDLHVRTAHGGARTFSDTIARVAANERGVGRFFGDVRISREAHRADASLRGDGLVLSRDAYLEAIPTLDIATNDVAARHAATIGSLDDDQLFYVLARGIARGPAERMLALAFFEAAIARFPSEALREEVRSALDGRLDDIEETFAS